MNIVEYGLGRIFSDVGIELINMAFVSHPNYQAGSMRSTEDIVRQEVIIQRVLVDVSVVGGQHVTIPLSGQRWQDVEGGKICTISMAATNGRHITSVLGIEQSTPNTGSGPNMIAAIAGPASTGTADVELVGNNVILVRTNMAATHVFLRCVLANDKELANLNPMVAPNFGQLCVHAAEFIIYRKLNMAIGDAGRNGGQVNSALQTAVERLSDTREIYYDFLKKVWKKTAVMQDHQANKRLVYMGMPS